MNDPRAQQLRQKVPGVIARVEELEAHFRQSGKKTSAPADPPLAVLEQCLPDLKQVLQYALQLAPLASAVARVVMTSLTDLERTAEILAQVKEATEEAAFEVLDQLERIDQLLEEAARDEGDGAARQDQLEEARDQLRLITKALQGQDLAGQQIEKARALLADQALALGDLAGSEGAELGDLSRIEFLEGTFEPDAAQPRKSIDQADIDRLFEAAEERRLEKEKRA